MAQLPAPRRALFLDRDGVINVDHGYVHTPAQTTFKDGIFTLCKAAHANGYVVVVVTNQAGIARGKYSDAQFIAYTQWMHGEFQRHGTPLLATYYCPHHPDGQPGVYRIVCPCRKPAPGMLLGAAEEFGLGLQDSLLIGDQLTDMAAAKSAGVGNTILLGGDDSANEQLLRQDQSYGVCDLGEAMEVIRRNCGWI